eukprot:2886689-Pleurochrysis_carterae.AAC.1
MSLAARRAFISGVPTSDARMVFGLHIEGWKHALHELTADSKPFEGAIARMIAAAEAQRRLHKQECQWGGRAEPDGRRFHHDLSAYGLDARVMLAPRAQQASQARLLLFGLNSLRDSTHARRFPSAAMDAEN